MIDGTSSARITVASKMIPAASPIANCLMSGPGLVESDEEREHQHERRARHELAGAREPELDRLRRVAGLVVGLAHAREHEDLVVHRDPVEEREDHQRDPGDDRVGRLDVPDRLAAVALLEDEDDDPVRGAERDQVQDHRLQRQDHRPERAHEQDEGQQEDEEQDVRELAVDRVRRSRGSSGRRAAERDRGRAPRLRCDAAARRRVCRFEIVFAASRELPSCCANASTSAGAVLAPRRRRGGAVDPGALATSAATFASSAARRAVLDEHDVRQVDARRDARAA